MKRLANLVLQVTALTLVCAMMSARAAESDAAHAWVDCVMNAIMTLDDGKSDPISIAYGIEPQCAVQYESEIQSRLTFGVDGVRAEMRRDELQLITSFILRYRSRNAPQSAPANTAEATAFSAAYDRHDYVTAFALLRPLAERGNADAQNRLGVMYEEGKGVAQDDAQAVFWYRKAAEQGYAAAQTNLGFMYGGGKGVAQDDTQAALWYRKAAEQGYAMAQTALGLMYEDGKGVTQNDAQGVFWYRKAAEQGYAIAQSMLGGMYFSGKGVPTDYVQAYKWLTVAMADASEREMCIEIRNIVEASMKSAQIVEARKLASEWNPMPVTTATESRTTAPGAVQPEGYDNWLSQNPH